MVEDSKAYPAGRNPWRDRVTVAQSRGRAFAYRPGRLLVGRAAWDGLGEERQKRLLDELGARVMESDPRTPVVIEGVRDVLAAAERVRRAGLDARPDHVFFATPESQGVGGAPVMFGGVTGSPVMFGGVGGAPVMFGGVGGAPVMFGGVGGQPVMFGGVGGAPVMFGGGGWGGCCCCGGPGAGPEANPAPSRSTVATGRPPEHAAPGDPRECRVTVLDTGLASERFRPQGVAATHGGGATDEPDVDDNGVLDAAAGHATFIAAIVEGVAPGVQVDVRQVLSTHGDASDHDVAVALWQIFDLGENRPHVLNLSFAGYSDDDTAPLAIREPLAALAGAGVVLVASAGNDATCRPAWPASVDRVIAVGAIGPGGPAWFTNHGPWVRACAPGVDVLSRFFVAPGDRLSEAEQADVEALGDIVDWATWSGTSFAAPIVAGVLARAIQAGWPPAAAVARHIDGPGLLRIAGLGTVINERPF